MEEEGRPTAVSKRKAGRSGGDGRSGGLERGKAYTRVGAGVPERNEHEGTWVVLGWRVGRREGAAQCLTPGFS